MLYSTAPHPPLAPLPDREFAWMASRGRLTPVN
jgi:hypothetical protein